MTIDDRTNVAALGQVALGRAARIILLGFFLIPGLSLAQDATDLATEIRRADAELFKAFNACDLETQRKVFTKDLEFYHDLAGVSDYESTLEVTQANCERKLGLRRELVEGADEVHPIADFGAIHKGQHTFCHLENGRDDCGTFDFVHVWKRADDGWKISRVISYGH